MGRSPTHRRCVYACCWTSCELSFTN